ncbi:MAG TPA: peptidoglycan-binding protein [Thermoleophilaceae bacterium]
MTYANGRLPSSALAPIPGGQLARDAAAAFNAMNAESERRFGVTLQPEGPLGSYRTYEHQVYLWQLYRSGRGNLAAVPGTSNHGWGLAVDFTWQGRQIVDQIGARYGWAKRWSDAQSEWWHIRYRAGVWHGTPAEPPRPDRQHDEVAVAQQLLRAQGFPGVGVDGLLGSATKIALRQLQERHGLPVTGEVDQRTMALLRGGDHAAAEAAEPRPHHSEPHAHDEEPRPHHAEPPLAEAEPSEAEPAGAAPSEPPSEAAPAPPTLETGRFPLNRVVALLGPVIATVSGTGAAWLVTNFPGLGLDVGGTTEAITQATTFGITALITWAMHHKWLHGWQQWEQGVIDLHLARVKAGQAAQAGPQAVPVDSAPPPGPLPFTPEPAPYESIEITVTEGGPGPFGAGRPSDG